MTHQRPAVAAQRDDTLDQLAIDLPDLVNTVKKISTATRMKDSAILEASPMPSQITNSGARTTRGMALRTLITGSSSSAMNGTSADDAERDADRDAERETAQRGREGRVEMRPDAAVRE